MSEEMRPIMNEFKNDINLESMMNLMLAAISEIDPDDLAFLFATGKSELEIRNQIALRLNRGSQGNQVVAREWNRHDLAVLEFGIPKILIEGKSWIHADAVSPAKMYATNKSIITGLDSDIKKMLRTEDNHRNVNKFITMMLFTVDVQDSPKKRVQEAAITYADSHRRGIESHENATKLSAYGRRAVSELLERYGQFKCASLNVGAFQEFKVTTDFFLLQPDVIFSVD
jgi:hypothetical protein